MNRGYVKLWRRVVDSTIFQMPPMHYKVWTYILLKANWSEKLMPTAMGIGIWVSPGVLITSLERIAEGVSYEEHGVTRQPNKKTVVSILDWLQDNGLIIRESNAHGTGVFVINWNTYQSDDGEKVTRRAPPTGLPKQHQLDYHLDTTKEVKEGEEVKRTTTDIPPAGAVVAMSKEFLEFYKAYPKHEDKHDAWRAWQKLGSSRPPLKELLEAIDKQKRGRKWQEGFIKAPASWLRKGSWLDDDKVDTYDPFLDGGNP